MWKVYLCGPIQGRSDVECEEWRTAVKARLPSDSVLDPMRRDYRGLGPFFDSKSLVEGDKADIALASVVLVYYDRPSVGTSMEILFAWMLHKPIILVNRAGEGDALSPWLYYHATWITPSLEAAIEWLLAHLVRCDAQAED